MIYSDDQLLAMIQENEEERDKAMKYFFTDPSLESTVIRKIVNSGGREYDAKDAFQEGFKAFYKHLVQGKFQRRSSLRTFFISICIRCWLNGLKKNFYQRTTLTEKEPLLDQEYQLTPEIVLMDKDRKSKLEEVLGRFGDRCKDVIMLGHQGYSSDEIKDRLQLSESLSIPKIRYRCMQQLMESMQESPQLSALLKTLKYG